MLTITLHCSHCGSEALVRDGHAPNGFLLHGSVAAYQLGLPTFFNDPEVLWDGCAGQPNRLRRTVLVS